MSRNRHHHLPKFLVDVVITTSGRWDLLPLCLEALRNQTFPSNVILIDHNSDMTERRQNESLFEGVVTKRLVQDIGFPAANNEGARMGNAPLILFLNDDCILEPDAIEKMVKTMDDPSIGVCGAKLLFPKNPTSPIRPAGRVQHIGIGLNIRGEVFHPLNGWSADNQKTRVSRDVLAVTGACLMVRRSLFSKVGGFDKQYGMGCLTAESLVFTEHGILSLADILNNVSTTANSRWGDIDISVGVDSVNGIYKSSIFHKNGIQKVRKMTTVGGYKISGTLNHKFVVMKEDGCHDWKELKDIRVGDYVALKLGSDMWGENILDKNVAYLLGLYIAEGCTEVVGNSGRITITNGDKEIGDFLLSWGFSKKDIHYRRGTKEFYDLMVSAGVNPKEKALTKTIPHTILCANKDTVIEFLRGLFDGDGCAIKDGRVTYSTSSYTMVRQIQLILLNFGITSTISKKISFPNIGYTLDLGRDSSLFYSEIGFGLPRKQSRSINVRTRKTRTIPYQRRWINLLYKMAGTKFRNNKLLSQHAFNPSEHVSESVIRLLLEERYEFKDTETYQHLEDILNLPVAWMKVTSLEDGEEEETFDLHVPVVNNYIANGFVSHNTYEDTDLCLKIRSLGQRVFVNCDAQGWHYTGATAEKKKVAFPLQYNSMLFKSRWLNTPYMTWDEFSWY